MVRRVLIAAAAGALLGALLGLVSRLPMRVVAVARLEDTAFSVGGTLGIALVFAVAATGAAVAGALGWRWLALLLVVPTSTPMLVAGTGIGSQEISGALHDDLAAGRLLLVLAMALVIAALALAAPTLGYRVGRARP